LGGELLIVPWEEQQKKAWQDTASRNSLTVNNYSYALLQIPTKGARRREWQPTGNDKAAIISDRNIATQANPKSSWAAFKEQTGWIGGVAFNDAHVEWLKSPTLDTRYGDTANKNDNLFRANSKDDALLIHAGN
jgi:hypothetical protein